jgi:hypothetical protein
MRSSGALGVSGRRMGSVSSRGDVAGGRTRRRCRGRTLSPPLKKRQFRFARHAPARTQVIPVVHGEQSSGVTSAARATSTRCSPTSNAKGPVAPIRVTGPFGFKCSRSVQESHENQRGRNPVILGAGILRFDISCSRWCCRSPRRRSRNQQAASLCRRSCRAGSRRRCR